MSRFDQVKEILEQAVNGEVIGAHGNFWRNTTRDQLIAKKPFGRQLLIVGDGSGSNLVKALLGEAPFGADLPTPPSGAIFSRMPAGFPAVSTENIEFIRQWIDDECPEVDEPASGVLVVDPAGGGPVEGLLHNALWREFD